MNFSLSLDNLKRVPLNKYEDNFTFIINNKRYSTSRIIADLLSPIISQYHYQDETISEFSINLENTNINTENDYFADFLNHCTFDPVEIDQSRFDIYCEYFLQLGNYDEFLKIFDQHLKDLTPSNAIKNLRKIASIVNDPSKVDNTSTLNKLIDYCSEHFTEIDKEELKTLDIYLIERIIQNKLLCLDEEDTLLNFILDLYNEDKEYSYLLEYVYFNNVNNIENFINEFDISYLNQGIWKSICSRLYPKKGLLNRKYLKQPYQDFTYTKGKELFGIMRYLTIQTGGNIHDNKTIEITTNSVFQNDINRHPKNLVDYEKDNRYHSANFENSWVCFDFKEMKIQLTSYSVKSNPSGPSWGHLKNWNIEVSNDANNWEVVDHHLNDSTLNYANAVANFETKKTDSFYQYIRLRLTGKSWQNCYSAYFPFIEFFGKLIK